jgi:hypothetical protein
MIVAPVSLVCRAAGCGRAEQMLERVIGCSAEPHKANGSGQRSRDFPQEIGAGHGQVERQGLGGRLSRLLVPSGRG